MANETSALHGGRAGALGTINRSHAGIVSRQHWQQAGYLREKPRVDVQPCQRHHLGGSAEPSSSTGFEGHPRDVGFTVLQEMLC